MGRWSLLALVGTVLIAAAIHLTYTRTVYNQHTTTMPTSTLSLKLSAFADGSAIPAKYTCDEQKGLSPEIEISGVPAGTVSLALIMDDPDVPKQLRPDGLFVHWVLFNIPATTTMIPEGGSVGVFGSNGAGQPAYAGPCPPPQYEPSTHRYVFKLYALDQMLPLAAGATKEQVEKAMEGHVIGQTQYSGTYKRQ